MYEVFYKGFQILPSVFGIKEGLNIIIFQSERKIVAQADIFQLYQKETLGKYHGSFLWCVFLENPLNLQKNDGNDFFI